MCCATSPSGTSSSASAATPRQVPSTPLDAPQNGVGVTATVSMATEESYSQLIERVEGGLAIDRLRGLTEIGAELARACHRRDIAVDQSPVSANGLLELPHWLREQAISRTLHRYGSIRDPRP